MLEIPYRKRRYPTARGRQPRAHGGTPALGSLLVCSPGLASRERHDPQPMEQYDAVMTKPTPPTISPDRLRDLITELRRHAPQWAERLSHAQTEHEILAVVCKLFDLSYALAPAQASTPDQQGLSRKIAQFISDNLHRGLTLKLLAEFLGYSEKYCSDLFRSTMGESFTRYLKRERTDTAVTLLQNTDKPIADIASSLGFSDQFSFSHFFKRATGRSPRDFRPSHARIRRIGTSPPPLRKAR